MHPLDVDAGNHLHNQCKVIMMMLLTEWVAYASHERPRDSDRGRFFMFVTTGSAILPRRIRIAGQMGVPER